MNGTVLWWKQEWAGSFGQILGENGRKYRVVGRDVESDCLGRTYLEPNEPVTFVPSLNHRSARGVKRPWKATDISPEGTREVCAVRDDKFLIRVLGGFLSYELPSMFDPVEGNIVECSIRPSPGRPVWRAYDLTFVADSEEEYVQLISSEVSS